MDIIFENTFVNEDRCFYTDNHADVRAYYTVTVPNKIELDTPLKVSTDLIDEDSNNAYMIRDSEIPDNNIFWS